MASIECGQCGRGRIAHLFPLAKCVLLNQFTSNHQQIDQKQTGPYNNVGRLQISTRIEGENDHQNLYEKRD
jgi:hypothetical protein